MTPPIKKKLTHIVYYKYQQRSLQSMTIDPKFVELTADVLEGLYTIYYIQYTRYTIHACYDKDRHRFFSEVPSIWELKNLTQKLIWRKIKKTAKRLDGKKKHGLGILVHRESCKNKIANYLFIFRRFWAKEPRRSENHFTPNLLPLS